MQLSWAYWMEISKRPQVTRTSKQCSTMIIYVWSFLSKILLVTASVLLPQMRLSSFTENMAGSAWKVYDFEPSWAGSACRYMISSQWKLVIGTSTTQLSHLGIDRAIFDLCSKCNIWPLFWPQNSLVMQLWIAYVLPVDQKVSHAENEPDLWRTESARGA